MNNKITMLLAAGALVVGAQQAKALTWSDAQNPSDYMNALGLGGGSASVTGTFDLKNPGSSTYTITAPYPGLTTISDQGGFVPGTDVATSATAFFWFRDDNDPNETEHVAVNLNGLPFTGGQVTSEGVSVFGGTADVTATINLNGTVTYTVTATDGDFFFDYADLTATGDVIRTNAPDGGATASLLGVGLLGVAAIRRKLS
jgi:hypothetical protein